MSTKDSKTKEERLLEMYIKDYITTTQFYDMLKRIQNGNK